MIHEYAIVTMIVTMVMPTAIVIAAACTGTHSAVDAAGIVKRLVGELEVVVGGQTVQQEPAPHRGDSNGSCASVELRGVSDMLQPALVVDAASNRRPATASRASGVEIDTLASLLALWRWALAARCGLHAVLGHVSSEP